MTNRVAHLLPTCLVIGLLVGCQSATPPTPTSDVGFVDAMATCLEDAGWQVERSSNGETFEVQPPDDQVSAYEADYEACLKETGQEQVGERLDSDGAGAYFDALLSVKDCLTDAGYMVADPPSRQSFVDDYLSGQSGGWTPYATDDPALTQEQTELCPQPAAG